MPAQTTNLKLPYPLGTDLLVNGDNDIKALADRIEARMPWGWLAYAEKTTAQGSIGNTLTDVTGLSITFTAVANRRIRLSARGAVIASGTTGFCNMGLHEGATGLQYSEVNMPNVAGNGVGLYIDVVIVPTAGAHTYKVVAMASTGTMTYHAAANRPAYILAEDLGPTSLA